MGNNNDNYGYIKVAALSPHCEIASPEENLKSALADIFQTIVEGHAQVVVLPELFLSAYTCGDLFGNSRLLRQCSNMLCELARETAKTNAVIVIGVPLVNGEQLYNCAAVVQNGRILGVVPKMHPSSYGEFNEKRWFASGADSMLKEIVINGEKVPFGKLLFNLNDSAVMGIEIGEDFCVPVQESSIMSLNGANIILNLSADAEKVDKNEYRINQAKIQSSRCICAYAQANAGMGESTSEMVFAGACIMAENGSVLASSERFKEGGFAIADFDAHLLNAHRRESSFFENAADFAGDYRRVDAEVGEIALNNIIREYSAMPFVPQRQSQINSRCKDIFAIQTAALCNRLRASGREKIVIGFYNDLGSALAVFVALNVCSMLGLPAQNVICIADGNEKELENISAFFDNIAAKPVMITLNDIYEDDYDSQNERERVKMCAVLNRAEREHALVLGTDVLTRLAIHIDPYVGARSGMYNVNASVPSTMQRHIFSFIVNMGIVTDRKALEAFADFCEKCEAESDADGIPVEVADFFLYYFIHCGFDSEKIIFIGERAFGLKYSRENLIKWIKLFMRRFFATQSARSSMPDSPLVGSVSLAQRCSWHMPSDADCKEFEEFTTYDNIRRVPPVVL